MNRELRYALQGTARHTIFEGETWVSDLLADLTEEILWHTALYSEPMQLL